MSGAHTWPTNKRIDLEQRPFVEGSGKVVLEVGDKKLNLDASDTVQDVLASIYTAYGPALLQNEISPHLIRLKRQSKGR